MRHARRECIVESFDLDDDVAWRLYIRYACVLDYWPWVAHSDSLRLLYNIYFFLVASSERRRQILSKYLQCFLKMKIGTYLPLDRCEIMYSSESVGCCATTNDARAIGLLLLYDSQKVSKLRLFLEAGLEEMRIRRFRWNGALLALNQIYFRQRRLFFFFWIRLR